MKRDVSYIDIVNYFLFSKGVDGKELRNHKGTNAYNYVYNNKEHRNALSNKHGNFLKPDVEPSQTVSQGKHQV